jgi:hypothetical protein
MIGTYLVKRQLVHFWFQTLPVGFVTSDNAVPSVGKQQLLVNGRTTLGLWKVGVV